MNRLKKLLPEGIKGYLKAALGTDATKFYSQFGEDAVAYGYFRGQTWVLGQRMALPKNGFFVDIGAYSPTSGSNTHVFYEAGWRGINIDAAPGAMKPFNAVRRRDINLNVAVGSQEGRVRFWCWGIPSVFNTADEKVAQERTELLGKPQLVTVPCQTMANIISTHMPADADFRLLSVDVEGRDLDVLMSNDWTRFRPELIIAESLDVPLPQVMETDLYRFLLQQGYELIAWVQPSLVFRDIHPKTNAAAIV
jgi:hypothetical protein